MRGNSHRATERRPRRKTVFLEALVDTVNVTLACRRAGIARRTAYDWREADAGFARKWDDAIDEGVDLLEAELHKRAFEGVERPVYYKGEQVGTWRFYSDALAMFLLKAHRPERYRGTVGSGAVAKALTPEEQAEAAEKEEPEAEARGYRAMFERIWAAPGKSRTGNSPRRGTGLPANTGAGRLNVSDSEFDSDIFAAGVCQRPRACDTMRERLRGQVRRIRIFKYRRLGAPCMTC